MSLNSAESSACSAKMSSTRFTHVIARLKGPRSIVFPLLTKPNSTMAYPATRRTIAIPIVERIYFHGIRAKNQSISTIPPKRIAGERFPVMIGKAVAAVSPSVQ